MAKREGFVDIHHDGIKAVAQVPEETFAVYEERGWKSGHKEYKTTTAPADEKKGLSIMAKLVYEGNVKVRWLAAVPASLAAPTSAEISAGVDLTPFIAKDGVSVPSTQNMVDVAGLNDVYNAEVVGSWGGGALTLTMFRDDTTETNAYALIVYGTNGALVISRFGTPAAASKVEVWPVEMHEPTLMTTAKDEVQKFTAAFAVTGAPAMRAVVAA